MDNIKKDSIDINKLDEEKYYFKRDIIIVMPNDTVYCADAFIIDVINANADIISDSDRLVIDSMLFEIFDDKTICPEISIMKNEDGILKLRPEDPYKPNLSSLDLVGILIKTKKKHIITRPVWEYVMSRYPNITNGVIPTVLNTNMNTYYDGDNNYFLIDDLNMPFDERKLIEFLNPQMVNRIFTVKTGGDILSKMVYEVNTDLPNKIVITLITSEFGNHDLIPILFNIWFTNDKMVNVMLEHIDYALTIIQDSIVNQKIQKEVEAFNIGKSEEDREILPYTIVDIWNPHLAEELEIQNKILEMQQKIAKTNKYI